MNEAVASATEDDLPALLETMYAHATMASGDSEYQDQAYKNFCKNLSVLEGVLKDKGLLSDHMPEE